MIKQLLTIVALHASQVSFQSNQLEKIIVVFGNHLDIGFEAHKGVGFAKNVVTRYFQDYFPKAIQTANELESKNETYSWYTHSWLISLYFDCPLYMGIPCPSVEQKLQLKKAIQRGDIIYHAFPFNSQIEFLGKELISFGINMTHELDNFFSIAPKTVLSQRDVPGFTVSAIPTLVSHNITGISIGVNPGSSPVHVPRDRPFLWKHRETNTSIIVTYHAGGYGSTSELTYYPGDSVGLFHAWRGDNEGPHDTQEVLNILADIRKRYPGISVESGSFDEYYATINRDVLEIVDEEMGDTWIYGVASDPWKTAQHRRLSRLHENCIQNHQCDSQSALFRNFSRFLLKGGEHTWGADVKITLGFWNGHQEEFKRYNPEDFFKLKHTSNYQALMESWDEQRLWTIDYAIEALRGHSLFQEAQRMYYKDLLPVFTSDKMLNFDIGKWKLQLNEQGAIIQLSFDEQILLKDQYYLGQLEYQQFGAETFDHYLNNYGYCPSCKWWVELDFAKPGLNSGIGKTILPKLLYSRMKGNLLEYSMSFGEDCFGAPRDIFIAIYLDQNKPSFSYEITWNNKKDTRIPESLSVYFHPKVTKGQSWLIQKSGYFVDSAKLFINGSRNIHYVDPFGKIQYPGDFQLTTLDAGLILVGGQKIPLPVPLNQVISQEHGFGVNLLNNLWGTNYVEWYPFREKDQIQSFRFIVDFAQ